MNKVQLVGRFTKDPEVRYSQGDSQIAIARFNLACDRRRGEGADFIGCVAFGRTAEFIEKYFNKGMRIGVTGHIQTGSYEKDGSKVYTTDVIIEEAEFVESKSDSAENKSSNDGFMNIPEGIDEELPFN